MLTIQARQGERKVRHSGDCHTPQHGDRERVEVVTIPYDPSTSPQDRRVEYHHWVLASDDIEAAKAEATSTVVDTATMAGLSVIPASAYAFAMDPVTVDDSMSPTYGESVVEIRASVVVLED
jgi:hypothetical protein